MYNEYIKKKGRPEKGETVKGMKKYYKVEFGEVVSVAELIGYFNDIWDAKEAAFGKMYDGDMLVGFDMDFDAEYTDKYGYDTVDFEKSEDKAYMCKTDGTMEGIPEGLWFWSDDLSDTTYYNGDGKEWDGEELLEDE
jgi:hypothetical protein